MRAAMIEQAVEFAERAHAGQKYGDGPYTDHLTEVYEIVMTEYGGAADAVSLGCAAYLHDVLEDTDTTESQIAETFGGEVAALVSACTGVGPNRRARNVDIALRIHACPRAAKIKLADRLANVRSCWRTQDARLFMYHREHSDFRSMLLRADRNLQFTAAFRALDAAMGVR